MEGARVLLRRGATRTAGGLRTGVGRTVVLLGITSLFTDLSSEMVTTVLPLYLVYSLGLTPLQFGFIDGLNNGAAGIVRLVGGGLGDRFRRYKEVAATGYTLSALTRPGFILVGNSFAAISGLVLIERIGKGIRTAPRDALIALSTPKENLGAAFGVHRALDTMGAMIGPLVAFGILAAAPDDYRAVFVASFAAAIVGVAVIVLLVKPDHRPFKSTDPKLTWGAVTGLVRIPRFRALGVVTGALGLATISDAFVYLHLQHSLAFNPRYLPLLYVGTAAAYMVLALPLGWVADRVGREKVFVGGYLLLLGVYALLLTSDGGFAIAALLLLFGAYYAATDGVLAAASSAILPEHVRGSGLSLIATLQSLARFGGSIMFGAIWYAASANVAVAVFAGALAVAIVFAVGVVKRV